MLSNCCTYHNTKVVFLTFPCVTKVDDSLLGSTLSLNVLHYSCALPGCALPGCTLPGCTLPGCTLPGCALPGCVCHYVCVIPLFLFTSLCAVSNSNISHYFYRW